LVLYLNGRSGTLSTSELERGDFVLITLSSGFRYVGIVLDIKDEQFFDVAWFMGPETGYYKTNAAMSNHIEVIGNTPWFAKWDLDEHL
jgi:hypothetical protein